MMAVLKVTRAVVLAASIFLLLWAVLLPMAAYAQSPTVPGAPTGVNLEAGAGSLKVTWDPPTNDGGETITDWDVAYRIGSTGGWVEVATISTRRSVTITGLDAGTAYQVRVRAENQEGEGAWSAAPHPSGTPNAVTEDRENVVDVADGGNYTSTFPSILRTHFGDARDDDNNLVEDMVDVLITWSGVPFATQYEIAEERNGVITTITDNGIGNQRTFRYDAPPDKQLGLVRYRIRGALTTGSTIEEVEIEGRTARIAASSTVYSPWSQEHIVSYSSGSPFEVTFEAAESTPASTPIPALTTLVSTVRADMGLPPELDNDLTVIVAVAGSLALGVVAWGIGGFGPIGMIWGVGVASLTLGIGGPALAGLSWVFVGLPGALLIIVVFMAMRGRLI